MTFPIFLAGIVVFTVIAVAARERFYDLHGRKYGGWQPWWKRMWAPPGSAEPTLPRPSTLRRDPDERIERARLAYWVANAVTVLYGIWGFANGGFPT